MNLLPAASSRLSAERRRSDLTHAAEETVDVLVVGLGVTGAGVALDAASRGLSVVAVDAHDLAFGTSRWSSKLVHGGLRYLANGQVAVAAESARERGILMTRTAPHLTRPLPMVIPLTPDVSRGKTAITLGGLMAGDVLRAGARTPGELLPRARRISAERTLGLAPAVRREGLRGGLMSHDGQLEDDARLVVAIARTAAAYGARILTRTAALELTGKGATLEDRLTGERLTVRARSVVNATGVWAGGLVPDLELRPSRGTHLVVRGTSLPGTEVAVYAPVPDATSRFVFALPQPDGHFYVGLTDEPVDGPIPDVPEPTDAEIDFLLTTISGALATPLTRADVVGAYAGLRPLLAAEGSTADLSRRHAVLTSADGVVTVVGGKLTTYRQMAEDAVDRVVALHDLPAGPACTADLPLVGAAPRRVLQGLGHPTRLVRRYGTEAGLVLENAARLTGQPEARLLAPLAPSAPTCWAELLWGVTHEGALDVEDLLDRRTRVGLVAEDRAQALSVARDALTASAVPG